MTDVRMDVKGDGDNCRLKINWGGAVADAGFYHVDGNRLAAAADKVRARLQDLVDAAQAKLPYEQALIDLAKEGAFLREEIFTSEEGEEEEYAAQGVREWFEGLEELSLHVTIDKRVYIPWGLAFDGDPEELVQDPSKAMAGFWCMKYRLSSLYNRILDRVVSHPRSSDKVRIVALVNEKAWEDAKAKVKEPSIARSLRFFENPGQLLRTSAEFDKSWRKEKGNLNTDMLYFFGHASGGALELSRDDLIALDSFPRILRRSPLQPQPACMIFLNGCQTAIGEDRQGGFLEATGSTGYCGFIGTEAKAPDDFALRFGSDFLIGMLLEGKAAIETMDELRRRYWPMSLIYNLSCHANFRFTIAATPEAAAAAASGGPR